MPDSRGSFSGTLLVALGVSLFCSLFVSATAVLLKPKQEQNAAQFQQRIVLEVAGLYEPGVDIGQRFAEIDTRLVELESGEYVDPIDAARFDARAASNDPRLSVAIPDEIDVAGIRRRAIYAPVYLVRNAGSSPQLILPVYGAGLWSTLYGYLSLDFDGNTVRGLRFYEHAETPGLGDQIENAAWLKQWRGKKLLDKDGRVRIEVVRGPVKGGEFAQFQVDGLSGATITGRGVTNLLHYWIGPHAFGPYLEKLAREANDDD